jgi:predicted RNA-binding protein YlqC (UPF0109 family)
LRKFTKLLKKLIDAHGVLNQKIQHTEMNPKEFTEFLLKAITPGSKNPLVRYDETSNVVVAQVDVKDQGRVIGKKGVTVASIAVLVWYQGVFRTHDPVAFRLLEPEKGDVFPSIPFVPKTNVDKDAIVGIIQTIFEEVGIGEVKLRFFDTAGVVKISVSMHSKKRFSDPDFWQAAKNFIQSASKFHGGMVEPEFVFTNALE